MIQSLPGYMASGAFPRRSPGTSARYWENVKRVFLDSTLNPHSVVIIMA